MEHTFLEYVLVGILVFVVVIAGLTLLSPVFMQSGITEGDIYSMEFQEAHTSMVMLPIVSSNGKTTTTTLIPYFFHYPDEWIVNIKAFNKNKNDFDTATFYVHEKVYDTLKIGDRFKFDDTKGYDTEPVIKERQK